MPLETYHDPPRIAGKFNRTKHDECAAALERREIELREAAVGDRRERLKASQRLRREENAGWEREGRRAHRSNMKVFREGRAKDIALALEVDAHQAEVKRRGDANAQRAMESGIDEFETNLRRLGVDTEARQESKVFDEQDYIGRIRQRKTEEVQGRRERTKRRQRMLLDQQKIYASIYARQKQEQLLVKIMRQSSDERNIGEELQAQAQWKNVMTANRKFREAQYEARRAVDEDDYKKLTEYARAREREMYEVSKAEELAKVSSLLKEKEVKYASFDVRFFADCSLKKDIGKLCVTHVIYLPPAGRWRSARRCAARLPSKSWTLR